MQFFLPKLLIRNLHFTRKEVHKWNFLQWRCMNAARHLEQTTSNCRRTSLQIQSSTDCFPNLHFALKVAKSDRFWFSAVHFMNGWNRGFQTPSFAFKKGSEETMDSKNTGAVTDGTVCNRGSLKFCSICKGPVYVCNPKLNTPCRKKHCGRCGYTFDIHYASDSTPICLKSLVRSGTHRTSSYNERKWNTWPQ